MDIQKKGIQLPNVSQNKPITLSQATSLAATQVWLRNFRPDHPHVVKRVSQSLQQGLGVVPYKKQIVQ